ncbi:MAG: restriction endonuclease [Ignavibacteriales bacterium]|nr:restriction endonuclease [Ignavibacteriales bacterium]
MAIPDFQTLMLPLLRFCADGKEHSINETIEFLAKEFQLNEDDLSELLPSGTQYRFYNRVYWAKAHLKMAGLVENTKRSHYAITKDGLELLKTSPQGITIQLLKTYPGYIEHFKPKNKAEKDESEIYNDNALTPEENLEYYYQKIRKSLAQEMLSKIKKMAPSAFEKMVVDLLVKMGYGGSISDAGKAIGRSGDEGIDGIIKEDKLGLDVIYIQAKRWEGVVGRPELQKFVGALAGQGAKKGIFITTSYFSKDAIDYNPKNETKIVLIDGEQLAEYMIDFDLAVSNVSSYQIKKIDLDYFGEE